MRTSIHIGPPKDVGETDARPGRIADGVRRPRITDDRLYLVEIPPGVADALHHRFDRVLGEARPQIIGRQGQGICHLAGYGKPKRRRIPFGHVAVAADEEVGRVRDDVGAQSRKRWLGVEGLVRANDQSSLPADIMFLGLILFGERGGRRLVALMPVLVFVDGLAIRAREPVAHGRAERAEASSVADALHRFGARWV